MAETLAASFSASFMALGQLGLVIGACAWLMRRGVFEESHIRSLSALVVNLALPCLVFSSILLNFNTADFPNWWKFPLVGGLLTLIPLGIGLLVFKQQGQAGRSMSALCSFQNAGYLLLPLGEVLFPQRFGRFSVFLFLMLLSYMPLLWSLGKVLISHEAGSKINPGKIFTAPFYAALLAMLLVFSGADKFFPSILLDSVELVGRSCIPMALVALGFSLGALHFSQLPSLSIWSRILAIKLLLLPCLMLLVLKYTGLSSEPLENAFWIFEASFPPATALVLQAYHYGGDEKLVSGVTLICYLAALFTIPFFYSIANALL